MRMIYFDIETRSACSLKASGAYVYANHPTTQVLCLVYAVDAEEPELWQPGEPVPHVFYEAAANPTKHRLIAHNAAFDRAILEYVLAPKHKFPLIPAEAFDDTMVLAAYNARPFELGKLAESLDLPYVKNDAARRAMLRLTKPKAQRRRKPDTVPTWHEDPADFALLVERCMTDVRATRAVWQSNRLCRLPAEERALWQLDQRINMRGIQHDRSFVEAARKLAADERTRINFALADLTSGEITSAQQVQRFIRMVNERGHRMASLTKRSVAAVLGHKPGGFVEQLLRLRQEAARASVRKYDSILNHAGADDRLRGNFRFYGSHTGRWSGQGPQLQNLKKNAGNLPLSLIEAVRAGDREVLAHYGQPLEVLANLSRAAICAASSHELKCGDFSAVESRVLAWLANETWKLAAYAEFDRTGDKAIEPYRVLARKMFGLAADAPVTPEQRQAGKAGDLGCGFGGSIGALRKIMGDGRSDAEWKAIVDQWRAAHPATKAFWGAVGRALRLAISNAGTVIPIANGRADGSGPLLSVLFDAELAIKLPSSRVLFYPAARLVPGKFEDGPADVEYFQNARGQWKPKATWAGTFVENIVQAVSRDLLVEALKRIDARGLNIVAHCHDEIVVETPIGTITDADYRALLIELPAWAEGLPISGAVHSGPHYLSAPEEPAQPIAVEGPSTDFQESDAAIEAAVDAVVAGEDLGEITDPAVIDRDDDREWVDTLPADVAPLYELTTLPLVGHKVQCPFHDDPNPSLMLYADHAHCMGCGWHARDRLVFLKEVERLTEPEAIQLIKDWDGSARINGAMAADDDTAARVARALQLWDEARPIAGTPAARYLDQTRGIDLTGLPPDVQASLRFHPVCPFGSERLSCLLALMRDPVTDVPTGIQRIALGLELDGSVRKIERRMLGRGGVVKLWPADKTLVAGEGLETVLAAATRILYQASSLSPAWACLSAHRLAMLPVISGVERLIVLVDHDPEGRKAADRVGATWRAAGCAVTTLMSPEPGADFNDLILKVA